MRRKHRHVGMIALVLPILVAGVAGVIIRQRSGNKVTLSTAVVERGTITTAVSGTGTLQPLTTVDVKSNVGGQLVYLGVDEGDRVRAGQVIARIDPADAQSTLEQSQADYESAQSKVTQAQQNYTMQKAQFPTQLQLAEQAVQSARLKLAQAEKQAKMQPQLTETTISQAKSNLTAAESAYAQTKTALIPQKISAAQSALDQAKANLDYAEKDVQRQRRLLAKGFVAQSAVDEA